MVPNRTKRLLWKVALTTEIKSIWFQHDSPIHFNFRFKYWTYLQNELIPISSGIIRKLEKHRFSDDCKVNRSCITCLRLFDIRSEIWWRSLKGWKQGFKLKIQGRIRKGNLQVEFEQKFEASNSNSNIKLEAKLGVNRLKLV